jgi:cyclase
MLKKRIIPCLDIRDGRTVKGVNFVDIIDAGNPVELARQYMEQGADELVFLDITATVEGRKTFARLVEEIAREISIPFTVGGGISTVEDVSLLLQSGADKVSINSSAVKNPELINKLAARFGSQCVVVAIDTNLVGDDWIVYTHGGRRPTKLKTLEWVREIEECGAGEVLLTSMVHDGTRNGFALELTKAVAETVNIPVIASGGAGTVDHFTEVFQQTDASAALAASIFHYGDIPVPQLKKALTLKGIPIR